MQLGRFGLATIRIDWASAWPRAALLGSVAGLLRIWGLNKNGFGNLYQAAAARSMATSWKNFFFASADPAGFLSLDKPPFAFWIQAAFVRLIGFSSLSIHLPQALEGVATVVLTYLIVRSRCGEKAGVLAGLAQAIMPVCVAVDRSTYAESCLVLLLLLAAWSLLLAVERGRLVFLLGSAALVGMAFNTKMLVAYGVVPAFVLTYLAGSRLRRRDRVFRFAAAALVMVTVSAWWGVIVDLTPPEHRPYVASSRNNSVFGLVFGHNGLQRILGIHRSGPVSSVARYIPTDQSDGMIGFGGRPGPLRMANSELAGQITWLLPVALIGSLVAFAQPRPRIPLDPARLTILLCAVWLSSYAAVFSLSRGIMHPYYLAVVGPPVAILFGIGAATLSDHGPRSRVGSAVFLAALILTAAWQAFVLGRHPDWRAALLPPIVVGVFLCALGMARSSRSSRPRVLDHGFGRIATALGLGSVLLAPACWSLMPVVAPGNTMIPVADPSLLWTRGGLSSHPIDLGEVAPLVAYLRAHRRGERYLVATSDIIIASAIVVSTGEPAVATRGFLGTDEALTLDRSARMIASRQLRFALMLVDRRSEREPPGVRASKIRASGGRIVDPAIWRTDLVRAAAGVSIDPRFRVGIQSRSPGSPIEWDDVGTLGMLMRRMELIDCRPGGDE